MYIFDTSTLIHMFRFYYKDRFPSLWSNFDEYISSGSIISVREAYNELTSVSEKEDLIAWANLHKTDVFLTPTEEEMKFVSEIFKNKHYQQLISNNAILNGKSQADPFIIASAKIKSACIVTLDGFTPSGEIKEHAPKIAFISKCLDVDCCNFEQFMAREDWKF